jgi:hypothetical protein
MIEEKVQTELLEQMHKLSPGLQQRVLGYAYSLAEANSAAFAGSELLKYAGIMSPEEAEEFLNSIEEDCERIDNNEW